MKTIKKLFLATLLAICFAACKEEFKKPTSADGDAPGPVKDISIEGMPGGAKISYTLPDDANLLYVKAIYERNGSKVESKASYFRNYIVVEGLGDTRERDVTLYTVSRGEKESNPVTVKIAPLPPAIHDVVSTLDIVPSYGGLRVSFTNSASTPQAPNNIVIQVDIWDPIKEEWNELDAHYTGLLSGRFAIRGLPAVERKFGFYVRDTWGNKSDKIERILTPLPEQLLDGTKFEFKANHGWPIPQLPPFRADGLPIVTESNTGSNTFSKLFDDITFDQGNTFHTGERKPLPIWQPFDMKVRAQISRYIIWQRMHTNNKDYFYNHGNPHEWELWGTNTPTDVNSWVLLDKQIMVKPSDLPLGQLTNDDIEIAKAGHEYELPLDSPPVRYVAFKIIDNWASIQGVTGFVHMSELKFYGQIK